MNSHIAFLRGINVGGHKKFAKADQLQMLEDLGYADSKVYLHTGNWKFSSSGTCQNLSIEIHNAIRDKFSWEVLVIVFKVSEVKEIMANCPFKTAIKPKSYFTLLEQIPQARHISVLKNFNFPGETFYLKDRCVYTHYENGVGRAKMTNNFYEQKLKVQATSRNFNTMTKVLEMAMA